MGNVINHPHLNGTERPKDQCPQNGPKCFKCGLEGSNGKYNHGGFGGGENGDIRSGAGGKDLNSVKNLKSE